MLEALRLRVLLGASEYQGRALIPYAKRLIELEKDTLRRIEATFMLVSCYENAQEIDSALYLIDGLIDYARSHRIGAKHFMFELERSGEVVVSTSRPVTVIKGNALVTNVEGSSLSIAGTARDVLARVPMVIDSGGVFEVFGKGAPAVYINGRLVNDKQELAQLNSRDIKSVEVITNPGAAYAANVTSVIRIRTKPPKGDGWSGTSRTDNGFARDFRTGNIIDLKYRTGGLEVFANYGWWRGHSLMVRTDLMTTATQKGVCHQRISTDLDELYNDMNGRVGFS